MVARKWFIRIGLVFLTVALVACSKAAATTATSGNTAPGGTGPGPSGGLADTDKLALGTLKLEGTDNAVTPAQAAKLLPLWQMIQGGSPQSDQETEAVLKQVEGTMTPAQMAAINGMALTWQDVQTWMQAQGIQMPTRAAGQGMPTPVPGQKMPVPPAGQGGPGGPQNLSAEERATRTAQMGSQRPQGGGPGGAGRSSFLVGPLVELLTQRAAQ